jgi:hypothetical protein
MFAAAMFATCAAGVVCDRCDVRSNWCVAAMLVIACMGLSSTASAQERKGVWFDFGVGIGSLGISATNFDDGRTGTGVVGLGLGWAATSRVLVGLDMRVAPVEIVGPIDSTVFAYNVGARVAYYPLARRGLFVKGTIGGSFTDVEIEQSGTTLTANVGKGLGLGTGVGYDVYVGRGFSLTPAVTYWYGRPGDFRFVGQTFFSDWSQNVVDVTIGVSFH